MKLNEDMARLDSIATRAATLQTASGPEAKQLLRGVVGEVKKELLALDDEVRPKILTNGSRI